MRIAIGIAVVLALAGCTAPSVSPSRVAPTAVIDESASPVLVATNVYPSVFLLADVSGELTEVGGCFALGDTATVFPVGTTRTATGLAIPGVGDVALGDRIEGGGGASSFGDDPVTDALWHTCDIDPDSEVHFLNPLDDN